MKSLLTIGLLLLLLVGCESSPDYSGSSRGADEAFYDFSWNRRPMVVFAPSLDDPRLVRQTEIMKADKKGFGDRDLTLIRAVGEEAEIVFPNKEKLRRGAGSDLRGRFGVAPDEFAVVVVGKDGNAKHRWSEPVDAATLFAAIE